VGATALLAVFAALCALPAAPADARARGHAASSHHGARAHSRGGAQLSRKRRPKRHRHKRPRPLSPNAKKAIAAYEAMQKYFYLGSSNLYREELNSASNSFLWPFSQAIAATVSVAHIRGQNAKAAFSAGADLRGLQQYVSSAPPVAVSSTEALQSLPHFTATIAAAGGGATSYYDDNDWVGIEMARLYELTHDEAALSLAEQIFAFEQAGWSTSTTNACPGGIPHSDSETDDNRSTISTAPAAELAVQLYRDTGNAGYLQFAEGAYAWVRSCLLTSSGLYADHLEANGEEDGEIWSYTQGVMIGAGALLYQATGNAGYLNQAAETANIALASCPLEILGAENPFFASVFLRNLIYLDSLLHDPAGIALANQYVNWSWNSLHEPNGLFLSANGSKTTLLEQAAVAQIYALLSTEPNTFF
jgi:uncharacterized protein YyaL (SSP411 family)